MGASVECQSTWTGILYVIIISHRARRLAGVKCACVGVGRRTGAVASTACRSVHGESMRGTGTAGHNEDQGTVMERSKPVPHDLTIPCPRPTHRCRRAPRLKTCPSATRMVRSGTNPAARPATGVHHGPCPSRRRASAWQQPAAKGSEPCVGGPVTV